MTDTAAFKDRAQRAAASVLAEHGTPNGYDAIVTMMAVAWLEGYGAGAADVQVIAVDAAREVFGTVTP